MNKDKHGNLKPAVGVAVIVRKDNKILFAKRISGLGEGTWAVPGGKIEPFESLEATSIRETKEETNVAIDNLKIVGVTNDVYKREEDHYVTIWLVSDYAGGEVKDMEPDKAEGWDWYEWDKLPKPYFLPVKQLLETGYNPFDDDNR